MCLSFLSFSFHNLPGSAVVKLKLEERLGRNLARKSNEEIFLWLPTLKAWFSFNSLPGPAGFTKHWHSRYLANQETEQHKTVFSPFQVGQSNFNKPEKKEVEMGFKMAGQVCAGYELQCTALSAAKRLVLPIDGSGHKKQAWASYYGPTLLSPTSHYSCSY